MSSTTPSRRSSKNGTGKRRSSINHSASNTHFIFAILAIATFSVTLSLINQALPANAAEARPQILPVTILSLFRRRDPPPIASQSPSIEVTTLKENILPSVVPPPTIKSLISYTTQRLLLKLKSILDTMLAPFRIVYKALKTGFANTSPTIVHAALNNKSKLIIYPESYPRSKQFHDPRDIRYFNFLSPTQVEKIQSIIQSPLLRDAGLLKLGKQTGFEINFFTVYQFLDAIDFVDNYHGLDVGDVIKDSILWRESSGIYDMKIPINDPLFRAGALYVSQVVDKHERSIIYVKLGRFLKSPSQDDYTRIVMHAVERADRIAIQTGSNKFVAVIDLDGFAFNKFPKTIWDINKHLIHIQKFNYPNRLSQIIIVNAGPIFSVVWSILKPLLPKKAISKVIVLDRKSSRNSLDQNLGLDYVEIAYGGSQLVPDFQDQATSTTYLSRKY